MDWRTLGTLDLKIVLLISLSMIQSKKGLKIILPSLSHNMFSYTFMALNHYMQVSTCTPQSYKITK